MKIGNPADKPPPTAPVAPTAAVAGRSGAEAAAGRPEAAAPAVAGTAEPSAQVDLSGTAAALMSTSAGAEFDAEKVARIQQAIADGRFTVDAGAIADKLIANAQELLGKVPH